MRKIAKENFNYFYRLFDEVDWELSAKAVLAGNNPGTVYADSQTKPSSAMMITPEGWIIVGTPTNSEFNNQLKSFFEEDVLLSGKFDDFEIYFTDKWKDSAALIFAKRPLLYYNRYNYKINLDDYQKIDINLPDEYKLILIEPNFAEANLEMRNMKHVKNWILNNWGEEENYSQKGFGYMIIKDDVVVSWSLADCFFEDKIEIGIHTDSHFRRKGFAQMTIKAMLNHAKDIQLKEVGWQCGSNNIGSYKTAERCGFSKQREYDATYVAIDEKSHYYDQIMDYFHNHRDPISAINLWNEMKKRFNYKHYHYYDIACGLALNNFSELAFENLKKAIEMGFSYKQHILNDSDLNNLHKLSEWNEIKKILK